MLCSGIGIVSPESLLGTSKCYWDKGLLAGSRSESSILDVELTVLDLGFKVSRLGAHMARG